MLVDVHLISVYNVPSTYCLNFYFEQDDKIDLNVKLILCLLLMFKKRNEVMKDPNKELVTSPIIEGAPVMRSRKQICQIIDTTLLKCYIQVTVNLYQTKSNSVKQLNILLSLPSLCFVIVICGQSF